MGWLADLFGYFGGSMLLAGLMFSIIALLKDMDRGIAALAVAASLISFGVLAFITVFHL